MLHRIKQQLIREHKIKKYLLYAAGEIILVVIGILIALKINNMNLGAQNRTLAYQNLAEIKADLQLNAIQIEDYILFLEDRCNRKRILLKHQTYDTFNLDSLVSLVQPLYDMVEINARAYNKAINDNIPNLEAHANVYNDISTYYTTVKNKFDTYLNFERDLTIKEAEYWYYNPDVELMYLHEDFPFINSEQEQKSYLINQISTVSGNNRLRANLYRKHHTLKAIKVIQTKTRTLIEAIDKTLKTD
ncbi:DUF6090 family protein [Formosa sp. S-31]|uniref:DUF6090 family protein n=1 Tax=Formosa sp. S-31 TaxID=2790949 RepID=UPI003EB7AD51